MWLVWEIDSCEYTHLYVLDTDADSAKIESSVISKLMNPTAKFIVKMGNDAIP